MLLYKEVRNFMVIFWKEAKNIEDSEKFINSWEIQLLQSITNSSYISSALPEEHRQWDDKQDQAYKYVDIIEIESNLQIHRY